MLLERTLSIYPYCVVRIIFPNRYVLQGVFQSTDSVADVITFTKTFVDEFILSFYLCKYYLKNTRIIVRIITLANNRNFRCNLLIEGMLKYSTRTVLRRM